MKRFWYKPKFWSNVLIIICMFLFTFIFYQLGIVFKMIPTDKIDSYRIPLTDTVDNSNDIVYP